MSTLHNIAQTSIMLLRSVQDANFDCSSTGFALQAMDSSHVSLIHMQVRLQHCCQILSSHTLQCCHPVSLHDTCSEAVLPMPPAAQPVAADSITEAGNTLRYAKCRQVTLT